MRRIVIAGAVILAAVFVTPLNAATSYTYDSLGRLWIVTYDNGYQVTYNYDSAGNRTTVVTQSGSTLPPVANNDYISTQENTFNQFDPRVNDSGSSLTITAVSAPSHGAAAIENANTAIKYTPGSNYLGPDSFTYTITDSNSHTSSATVYVTVTNVGPVANPDTVSTPMNTAVNYFPLANDVEPNPPNWPLSIASVGTPGNGSVVIIPGSPPLQPSLTYTPRNTFTGNDSFTYTISDSHGLQSTATDTVIVGNPPVAVADYLLTPANQALTYSPLVNDSDPNGYSLSIVSTPPLAPAPAHGTGSVVNGNEITYTPATGFTGVDTFNYTISDQHGLSASAPEYVCVGSPLTANADSVSILGVKYAPYTPSTTLDPRANDTDACGATFTVTSVTQPSQGSVSINTGGVSVYYQSSYQLNSGNTPLQVTDTFTYTITDSYGATSTATVTVHINVRYSGG